MTKPEPEEDSRSPIEIIEEAFADEEIDFETAVVRLLADIAQIGIWAASNIDDMTEMLKAQHESAKGRKH